MNGYQFSCSLVHLLTFFPGPLNDRPRISYEGDSAGIYSFYKVSGIQFGFESLSRSPEIFLFFFFFLFHLYLFDGVSIQYPQIICKFPFLRAFKAFLGSQFNSVRHVVLPSFLYQLGAYSMLNSIPMPLPYLLLESFSHQIQLMVFHWSLSDSKSPQVSRTLLSILAVLNNVWRCPWCNGHRRSIWTLRHEFKSWMRLIAFHIALIPLGKL